MIVYFLYVYKSKELTARKHQKNPTKWGGLEMLRFVSKKIALVLLCAFALWALPVEALAYDDAQDLEDSQKLSNTLLIVGLSLAIVALVGGLVYGSITKKKAANKKKMKEKKIEEAQSDSLKVKLPEQ